MALNGRKRSVDRRLVVYFVLMWLFTLSGVDGLRCKSGYIEAKLRRGRLILV